MVDKGFTLTETLPDALRSKAGEIYWTAFESKLGKLLGPREKGQAFIASILSSTHEIAAISSDGKLLGVAGFKTKTASYTSGSFPELKAHYGLRGALWRVSLLAILERSPPLHALQMDGICVSAKAQGKGVGTALLGAIEEKAIELGKTHVTLDVINTNPRAKKLYLSMGYSIIAKETLGPLKWLFGFSSSEIMEKRIT